MAGEEQRSERLPHGYTNLTRRLPGGRIEKQYEGADRFDRAVTELVCLTALGGRLPVPKVLGSDRHIPVLVLAEAVGVHGQELIDADRAAEVLCSAGAALRALHEVSPQEVPGLAGSGPVVVHGDFGPQNLLLDPQGVEVTAMLDWEFAHAGDPLEDLAWAEWSVRMHHPNFVAAIPSLYAAYGRQVPWPARSDAMIRQCSHIMRYCEANRSADAVSMWKRRLDVTAGWTERP